MLQGEENDGVVVEGDDIQEPATTINENEEDAKVEIENPEEKEEKESKEEVLSIAEESKEDEEVAEES